MEPLYSPNPLRVSVDETNATCMDVGGVLAALCARAQEFDMAPDEMSIRAFIGGINRVRVMLNMLEKHAIKEAKAVDVGRPTANVSRKLTPRSLRSMR